MSQAAKTRATEVVSGGSGLAFPRTPWGGVLCLLLYASYAASVVDLLGEVPGLGGVKSGALSTEGHFSQDW